MAKLNLGNIYFNIEAKTSSIDKVLSFTKITGTQKGVIKKEECLIESTTPQALQTLHGDIEAKVPKVQGIKKKNFSSYLAGLFEGDGHIWLPNFNMKKKHNARFCITFGLKNEPLAKKILDIIGYGHIRYKPKENACVLIVSPVKGLKKIIKLINGELRTPKIHQLHNLID